MTDHAEKRGQLIRHLEDAPVLADEIEDDQTGFLIERALDEARSRHFRPIAGIASAGPRGPRSLSPRSAGSSRRSAAIRRIAGSSTVSQRTARLLLKADRDVQWRRYQKMVSGTLTGAAFLMGDS